MATIDPDLGTPLDLVMIDITDPCDTDVLCGRGGAALRHPGNQTYRRLVNLNKGLYITCLKTEKLKISRSIVAAIREQRGRFLEKDSKKGTWYDIGDKKAVEKTSQALREGQPKLRQKIVEMGGGAAGTQALMEQQFGHPGLYNPEQVGLTPADPVLMQPPVPQQQQSQPQQSGISHLDMHNDMLQRLSLTDINSEADSFRQQHQRNRMQRLSGLPQDASQLSLMSELSGLQGSVMSMDSSFKRALGQLAEMDSASRRSMGLGSTTQGSMYSLGQFSMGDGSMGGMSNQFMGNSLQEAQQQQQLNNMSQVQQMASLMQQQQQRMSSDPRLSVGSGSVGSGHSNLDQQAQAHTQLLRHPGATTTQQVYPTTLHDSMQPPTQQQQQQEIHYPGSNQMHPPADRNGHMQQQQQQAGNNLSEELSYRNDEMKPPPSVQQDSLPYSTNRNGDHHRGGEGMHPPDSRSQPENNGKRSATMELIDNDRECKPEASTAARPVKTPVVDRASSPNKLADLDRRRVFAKMKYAVPQSGYSETTRGANPADGSGGETNNNKRKEPQASQHSLDGMPDIHMVESSMSLCSGMSILSIGAESKGPSAPDKKPEFEIAKVIDHSQAGRDVRVYQDSGSGSRRSIMSGLSRMSDAGSMDHSIFSDLSKKIGNVSTRSLAMSEISAIDLAERDSEDDSTGNNSDYVRSMNNSADTQELIEGLANHDEF